MKEQLQKLIETAEQELANIKENAEKFIGKDNKAAGTRVRTGSMDLIKTLKEVRTKVQEIKNS